MYVPEIDAGTNAAAEQRLVVVAAFRGYVNLAALLLVSIAAVAVAVATATASVAVAVAVATTTATTASAASASATAYGNIREDFG